MINPIKSHKKLIFIAATISIGLLVLCTLMSPIIDANAFKCVKQWDDAALGGACWYCTSTSGLHHTFLGPGCQVG